MCASNRKRLLPGAVSSAPAVLSLLLLACASARAGTDVTYATQGIERFRGLKPTMERHVVYSIRTDFLSGDTLRVLSEIGVTNDIATRNQQPGAYGWYGEWRYRVTVAASVILANSPGAVTGIAIVNSGPLTISANKHHGQLRLKGDLRTPYLSYVSYVNVVVWAKMTDTHNLPNHCYRRKDASFDFGTSCRLTIDAYHGKLDLLRFRTVDSGGFSGGTWSTGDECVEIVACWGKPRRVVYSIPMGDVRAGDIFTASATVVVSSNFTGFHSALASGFLIVGDSPGDSDSGFVIGRHNGWNLTVGNPSGAYHKLGAFQATGDMTGKYLNFVMLSGGGCDSSRNGKLIVHHGSLTMTRYRKI